MASLCDPQSLITAAAEFQRIRGRNLESEVIIYLLNQLAATGMTPQELMREAKGFRSIPTGIQDDVLLYLLCQIAAHPRPPEPPSHLAEVNAFWLNAIAAGGTVSEPTLSALDALVGGLKADGLWSKLTLVCPFCGDQLAASLVKLKYVGNASLVNHGFVAGNYAETGATAGIKGDGSHYLDSGFNPSSGDLSSFHLSAYVKGVETAGTTRVILASVAAGTTNMFFLGWVSAGTLECGAIGGVVITEYCPLLGSSVHQGLLSVATNGSRSQQFYGNGLPSGAPVTASAAVNTLPFFILAQNNAGSPTAYSTRYIRWVSIGTGLSATDESNLYTRVQAFQVSLSRNV